MWQYEIDNILSIVVKQAKDIGIPVSDKIAPHVVINSRAKTRFGSCKKVGSGYEIEISASLAPASNFARRQVIAHEVLHTCHGCRNHRTWWRLYAGKMNQAYGYNISRTDTYESLGIGGNRPKPNYIIVCMSCGNETGRIRESKLVKHPEWFRCRCGGKLKLKP